MPREHESLDLDLLTYYRIINRPRVTGIVLVILLVSTALIGILLYSQGSIRAAGIMAVFFLAAAVLYFLHLRGFDKYSLYGLIGLTPVFLTLVMVQGQGLHDVAMWGFSIYLVISPLLMGKRFLPFTWLVSAVSVVVIYLAESVWQLPWTQGNNFTSDYVDLTIVLIVLTIGASVFWIVMTIIETTIRQVIVGERQIKEAYDLTLEGWSRALEMRDKETQGHSRRVTTLTLKVARQIGLSGEQLFHIRRGALVHDIGKMAIPDRILHKPGPLTEEEWAIVKRHPLDAYEMLKDIEFLQPAMDIPLYHHEHWDGNGYPFQLAGEDIPLAARIFAVIDNWDALLSDRPYSSAWDQAKVIVYLQEQSGKRFDPQIVSAFLDTIKEE